MATEEVSSVSGLSMELKLTNGGQQTGDRGVTGITGGLVCAQDTVANALDNTDLGGLLVIKLTQAEGESAELLDNLGKCLAGAGALENVGGSGAAVQGSTVVKRLDLAVAQAKANLNTPNLTNLGNTFTTGTVARAQDDLLVALDLVAVKQPAGGVLDDVAVVGLGDLLQVGGDLSLGRRLLGGGLLLLLLGTLGQQTRRNHETQHNLVGVVGRKNQVGLAASDNLLGGVLLANDKHVTDDGSKAIDLSTQLDLDDLAGLQGGLGLGGIGHQRSVGSHIGARRDGSGVGNTFMQPN